MNENWQTEDHDDQMKDQIHEQKRNDRMEEQTKEDQTHGQMKNEQIHEQTKSDQIRQNSQMKNDQIHEIVFDNARQLQFPSSVDYRPDTDWQKWREEQRATSKPWTDKNVFSFGGSPLALVGNNNSRGQTNTGPFGDNNSNQATGGLFGNKNIGQTTGGLFGNSNSNQATGGLFGNNSSNQTTGGLFGNKNIGQTTGGLFGNSNSNQATGGLFGNNNIGQTPGGLFGAQNPPKKSEVSANIGQSFERIPKHALESPTRNLNSYEKNTLAKKLEKLQRDGKTELLNEEVLQIPWQFLPGTQISQQTDSRSDTSRQIDSNGSEDSQALILGGKVDKLTLEEPSSQHRHHKQENRHQDHMPHINSNVVPMKTEIEQKLTLSDSNPSPDKPTAGGIANLLAGTSLDVKVDFELFSKMKAEMEEKMKFFESEIQKRKTALDPSAVQKRLLTCIQNQPGSDVVSIHKPYGQDRRGPTGRLWEQFKEQQLGVAANLLKQNLQMTAWKKVYVKESEFLKALQISLSNDIEQIGVKEIDSSVKATLGLAKLRVKWGKKRIERLKLAEITETQEERKSPETTDMQEDSTVQIQPSGYTDQIDSHQDHRTDTGDIVRFPRKWAKMEVTGFQKEGSELSEITKIKDNTKIIEEENTVTSLDLTTEVHEEPEQLEDNDIGRLSVAAIEQEVAQLVEEMDKNQEQEETGRRQWEAEKEEQINREVSQQIEKMKKDIQDNALVMYVIEAQYTRQKVERERNAVYQVTMELGVLERVASRQSARLCDLQIVESQLTLLTALPMRLQRARETLESSCLPSHPHCEPLLERVVLMVNRVSEVVSTVVGITVAAKTTRKHGYQIDLDAEMQRVCEQFEQSGQNELTAVFEPIDDAFMPDQREDTQAELLPDLQTMKKPHGIDSGTRPLFHQQERLEKVVSTDVWRRRGLHIESFIQKNIRSDAVSDATVLVAKLKRESRVMSMLQSHLLEKQDHGDKKADEMMRKQHVDFSDTVELEGNGAKLEGMLQQRASNRAHLVAQILECESASYRFERLLRNQYKRLVSAVDRGSTERKYDIGGPRNEKENVLDRMLHVDTFVDQFINSRTGIIAEKWKTLEAAIVQNALEQSYKVQTIKRPGLGDIFRRIYGGDDLWDAVRRHIFRGGANLLKSQLDEVTDSPVIRKIIYLEAALHSPLESRSRLGDEWFTARHERRPRQLDMLDRAYLLLAENWRLQTVLAELKRAESFLPFLLRLSPGKNTPNSGLSSSDRISSRISSIVKTLSSGLFSGGTLKCT
jgi:hypothetical protein